MDLLLVEVRPILPDYRYGLEGDFELKTLSTLQKIQQHSVNYRKLSPKDCISAYSTFFLSTRRNLVLVTNSPSSANGSLLTYGGYTDFTVHENGLSWMCNSTYIIPSPRYTCRDALPKVLADANDWRPFDSGPRVQFCLSETTPETYSLQFSLVIILIVIICNIGKTLIMTFITFKMTWQPLITVGDGIASFLVEPDKTTKNARLLTVNKAKALESFSCFKFMRTSKKIRWFQSSSPRRGSFATFCKLSSLPLHLIQLIRLTSLILNLAISAGFLGYGIHEIIYLSMNFHDLWKLGFGAINQYTLIAWSLSFRFPSKGSQGLVANTLVANLPQVHRNAFENEKTYAYLILPVDSLLPILLIQWHLHLHAFG